MQDKYGWRAMARGSSTWHDDDNDEFIQNLGLSICENSGYGNWML